MKDEQSKEIDKGLSAIAVNQIAIIILLFILCLLSLCQVLK